MNWPIQLVNTDAILNTHVVLLIYYKGENSMSRLLQFGQEERCRMELPTLGIGQDQTQKLQDA